jgi:alpha-1,3-rhamnosyl/mannosyltransferase
VRVAVNLTWMTPGLVGGSEEYLTRQLIGVDPSAFEVDLYCDPAFPDAHPALAARFRSVAMPASGRRRAARLAFEHSWLALRTRDADVVHHGGGTAPVLGRRPIVLTIHDLQYVRHPEYFTTARRRYLEAMLPRSARRAAVVAVPSEFVRREVLDHVGLADERVVVVPHGVPHHARPDADVIRQVGRLYGVADRPYLVYPAITHPHKAHRLLVDLLDHLDDEIALVLIGGVGAAEFALAEAIDASRHSGRVVRPGRVSDANRDALIAGADALVFPSEFEGFGAPVVEAMALGTPVVCSAAGALVEVVGDAAVVVEAPSAEAWASAVVEARARRPDLIARGRLRREEFTIEASARAISDAYRQATS